MINRVNSKRVSHVVAMVVSLITGCIYSWKRRIRESLEPLRHAHGVSLETGDIEFGFVNADFFLHELI
jgi:hypothetical protein